MTPLTPVPLPPAPVGSPVPAPLCFQPTARCLARYDLILALDTEYQELLFDDGRVAVNDILCYSYTAVYREAEGSWKLVENILKTVSPLRADRMTYGQVLSKVLSRFQVGWRRAQGLKVLIVSHFGAAEWAAMRDREQVARDHLVCVRKCPVTFKSMPVHLEDKHKHRITVQVDLRDTELLSLQRRARLEHLAETTVHKKVDLTTWEISNMAWLMAHEPTRFIAYAIGDTRVTLEYYIGFMQTYEALFPNVETLPLTYGNAVVNVYNGYLAAHPWLSSNMVFGREERLIINEKGHKQRKPFEVDSRRLTKTLASEAFLGGLNQAMEHGEYVVEPDSIILDVDFTGAYVTAMAALPVLDWNAKLIPLLSMGEVESAHSVENLVEGAVPLMFAHASFAFPPDCPYPCLPVQSTSCPLFPQDGVTTCTGIELALAQTMGARIDIDIGYYFPTLSDEQGKPVLAFAEFLGRLASAREEAERQQPGSLRACMLKELGSSFYGKLTQGIEERAVYNFSGGKGQLKPSAITTPHYGAMTTGITRTALQALVTEVTKHPGCRVLSATTDGAMIVVPRYGAIDVGEDGRVHPPKDARAALGVIFDGLLSYYPIRCLEQGRINLGVVDPTWLKIAAVGDRAVTARTRGYYLTYNGVKQYFAQASTQVKDPAEWERLFLADEIEHYESNHLATMKEIMEGKYQDLVMASQAKKVNLDYDQKRVPLLDGSGQTRPPVTVQEAEVNRAIADNLRKHGQRATPERVQLIAAGLCTTGGTNATIYRAIHKAVAQDVGGWRPHGLKDTEIAERLGITKSAFKTYKRRGAKLGALPGSPEVEAAIADVAQRLGLDVTDAMRTVLLVNATFGRAALSHQDDVTQAAV